ncbi:hypothetical protein V8E36_006287 [Tilletia maclaganii]
MALRSSPVRLGGFAPASIASLPLARLYASRPQRQLALPLAAFAPPSHHGSTISAAAEQPLLTPKFAPPSPYPPPVHRRRSMSSQSATPSVCLRLVSTPHLPSAEHVALRPCSPAPDLAPRRSAPPAASSLPAVPYHTPHPYSARCTQIHPSTRSPSRPSPLPPP